MGKGELVMVSLPAWAIFRLRVSMKPVTFCSRERRVIDQQERRDENFDGGQEGGEVDCDGGEEDEDAEKQLGLGFWQPI